MNRELFKNKILLALRKLSANQNISMEIAQEQYADELSSLIDEYIRSAIITIPAGQAIEGINNPLTNQVIGTTKSDSFKATIR